MSMSPSSSGSTAVPSKGTSPRTRRRRDDDAKSPRSADGAARPSAGPFPPGSEPTPRIDIPTSSTRRIGNNLPSPIDSPFTFTVSSFHNGSHPADSSSPPEHAPVASSSCSSSSSVTGLTAAFSHVDVDAKLGQPSILMPKVAKGVFQPPPQPGIHAPPKKNTHSKPAPQGHVPRPRNPYILYRMDVVARGLIQGEKKHQNISKVVSEMWNALSTEDKAPYVAAAHLEKMEHKRLYPNYIYQPGTDRPKPTKAARVHKGSKAANTKAAAAAAKKSASSSNKKGKQDRSHLLAAKELEKAAEADSDHQPSKRRSTSSKKSSRSPRPSPPSRTSSTSSSFAGPSRPDEDWDSQAEYEQHGRKRRSKREPLDAVDRSGSPAASVSGRSVASESDVRGSTSGSSAYDDDRFDAQRTRNGFHVSYPPAGGPRPAQAHGQTYAPHYDVAAPQVVYGPPPPMPPPHYGSLPVQPAPSHFYYSPYPNYHLPHDVRYTQPSFVPQPGQMGPPVYPPTPPHPPQLGQPSGPPYYRQFGYQHFLPTAEPSPITPGFPVYGNRRGSANTGLVPDPPRRESAGFGLGFQEEETPRTAAFREAFIPRSPAYGPPHAGPGDPASATTSSAPTFTSERPGSDTTAQRGRPRNAGPLTELFTREALRPQTFPRTTTESSIRQSWHMGDQEMFVPPPAAHSPIQSDGVEHQQQQQQQEQQLPQQRPPTSHFAQPIQRSAEIAAVPAYATMGGPNAASLDLSSRRKGRPEPLAFPVPPPPPPQAPRQPYFRSLPAEPSPYGYHRPPNLHVTPTQEQFMPEYYTVPFDEGPAWTLEPSGLPAHSHPPPPPHSSDPRYQ